MRKRINISQAVGISEEKLTKKGENSLVTDDDGIPIIDDEDPHLASGGNKSPLANTDETAIAEDQHSLPTDDGSMQEEADREHAKDGEKSEKNSRGAMSTDEKSQIH